MCEQFIKKRFSHHASVRYKIIEKLSILVLILIHRSRRRAETLAVTLACIRRFQLRLLSGRNEMRVFFQIFNNLFGNHFALKTAQRAFDRFVLINCYKSHSGLSHSRLLGLSADRAN